MKAVIYARYSSDNQREESIEGQIRECTEYAEKNGITVLRHYIDRAFSAKTDNRPEFQNMIKDSNKKLFDMVIVWKLDRFSRNRYDSARYKSILKKNGVKVVSATESISEGAEGIILESVLEGYAEYYSADLSEKVVRGMTENTLKGLYNGGGLPIGYYIDENKHYQADPLTAPFVLEAFKRYADGWSLSEISDWFNEMGIKSTKGTHVKHSTIKTMLGNRRYLGELKFRNVVMPNMIPQLVPTELFDRVQMVKERNKKAPAMHRAEIEYLLTTKLFCGNCGAYMCGESGTGRNGNKNRYYKCVSVKKKRAPCNKKTVRKEWLEDTVVKEVIKLVMDDNAIEHIVLRIMEIQQQDNYEIPLYEKQLKEVDESIENILSAIQQGIFTKSTKSRLEELEKRKEQLEIDLADEKMSKSYVTEEYVRAWLYKFRTYTPTKIEHKRALIDTFVHAVYLFDDKMLIVFNCKGEKRSITFDDINGADISKCGEPKREQVKRPAFLFAFFSLMALPQRLMSVRLPLADFNLHRS